jgi:nucleoside-diphosphate-sugar epimerase
MRVLVTGATGFLGSHLVELLREQGHEVRALVRRSSKTALLESLGVELSFARLETGDGLDDAVRGVNAVVHGAALVKARAPAEFHRVNVEGTKNLLDAVVRIAPGIRRFALVSSITAEGFAHNGGGRRPVTHYGRSKLAAEGVTLAMAKELPVSILRPPAIYGPRDAEMFAFFQMVSRRLMAFLGSPENRLSLIYATDCARALYQVLTADHPSGSVYAVEDGRVYTQGEFAAVVADALGIRTAIRLSVPIPVVSVAAVGSELYGRVTRSAVMLTRDKVNELRQPDLTCRGDRIRDELGFVPEVQLEEGARRTVAWYREHGWL